jgi:bifunctional DNA-binding transcriptional regulator/antitoxin component of YhaV-PrlF toxin-antitoxin module
MNHKFIARLEKVNSSLGWNHHFIVPEDISEIILKDNRRVICMINNALSFQCGLFPKGKGIYFINLNKENRKKLGVVPGDELAIELTEDKSKYGIPIPPVFEELLIQDPKGEKHFHALTPGEQRSLLYIIAKPKSERLQLEKGLVILDFLRSFDGKVDFKGLNEALRNNRYK